MEKAGRLITFYIIHIYACNYLGVTDLKSCLVLIFTLHVYSIVIIPLLTVNCHPELFSIYKENKTPTTHETPFL